MTKSTFTAVNNISNYLNTGLPGNVVKKTVTFTALGDGAIGSIKLFEVTGSVAVVVLGVCATDLTGTGATVEVGITGSTALLVAQTTGTDIDAGKMWRDNSPATNYALNATNFPLMVISTDIYQKIGTHTVDSGLINYYCIWAPLSEDGNVVAA